MVSFLQNKAGIQSLKDVDTLIWIVNFHQQTAMAKGEKMVDETLLEKEDVV